MRSATRAAYKRLLAGHAEFRKVFPLYVCFPQVVPTDEVVTLKMFHREDEPLARLLPVEPQWVVPEVLLPAAWEAAVAASAPGTSPTADSLPHD